MESISTLTYGFLVVWGVVVLVYGLYRSIGTEGATGAHAGTPSTGHAAPGGDRGAHDAGGHGSH